MGEKLPSAGTTPESGYARHCDKCDKDMGDNEPDACWGYLPGVIFACCGHGIRQGYVLFENGINLRFNGKSATIEYRR